MTESAKKHADVVREFRERVARDMGVEIPDGANLMNVIERFLMEEVVKVAGDNQTLAGRMMGCTRYAWRYRAEKHGFLVVRRRTPSREK